MSGVRTVPKARPENVSHIADFAEFECLRRDDGNVSVLDIERIMARGDDAEDRDDISDAHMQIVYEAFGELESRSMHCGRDGGRYPYEVNEPGSLLQFRRGDETESAHPAYLYIFLLLATRKNMKDDRKHGGEDATVLFEHLCREISVRYWGGPAHNVDAMVFGTGRTNQHLEDYEELNKGKFQSLVDDLCEKLGEGVGFREDPESTPKARDGKLDIVVWRGFADKRDGQLIGFGQCKTGTHWRGDLSKLRPEDFFSKWVKNPPAVQPIRLYFVADRPSMNWRELCVDGGILFDRCRIMEYARDLPTKLMKRIAKWVKAAMKSEGLKLP
ncbi:MAG: hypothetical protein IIB38_06235 [Candidatus Hydrogenedentes bacterium]|nr:hypothetical protein [Candidatus Hydrogenedentota bacterium]